MSEHINPTEQLEPIENACPVCETPVAEPVPAPAPAFVAAEPIAPAPTYAPPAPTYAAPAPTYAAPAPAPTYAAPAPAPTYAAPAPAPTYAAPAPTYTAPAPTYAAPAPTYTTPAPTYAAPTYTYPTPAVRVATEPVVDGKTKAQGFVGMGLGIGSLVFAVIGLIYTLATLGYYATGFVVSLYFGLFSMPLSIVGKILCNKSQEAGNTSGACSAGGKLATAGMVVTIVMLAFGIISLLIGA